MRCFESKLFVLKCTDDDYDPDDDPNDDMAK